MMPFRSGFDVLRGLLSGDRAFGMPLYVNVDPTHRCNLQCACCRWHSPLLDKTLLDRSLERDLSPDVFRRFCADAKGTGIQTLQFVGAGEPLLQRSSARARRCDRHGGAATSRPPELRDVVIKQTLACTANCPTCALRRHVHADLKGGTSLSFERWRDLLAEAAELGASRLIISGGEPTLYRELAGLVETGRRHGLSVRVNSNGSLITEEYARSLLDAGLDVMCISLYATSPERMAAMRGNPVLWKKATDAIRILAALERDYPAFEVRSQTILSRENLADFPALLEIHASLGSRHVTVSYLEGDFERQHLPRAADVRRFREAVLPEALRVCHAQGPLAGRLAARNVGRLFSPALLAADDWEAGRYWSRDRGCRVPSRQALILANGDVHPCNIVEYTHEPVVGNLTGPSLTAVWNGEAWRRFRASGHDRCHLCPINRHTGVFLGPGSLIAALAGAVCPDRAGVPGIMRVRPFIEAGEAARAGGRKGDR